MLKESTIENAGQGIIRAPSIPAGATQAISDAENKESTPSEGSMVSSPTIPGAGVPVAQITTTPYSVFSKPQRRLLLFIVTVAGFFGPLSGGIYLPALPVLAVDFNVSDGAINATVSVFMVVFAVGVCLPPTAFSVHLLFPLRPPPCPDRLTYILQASILGRSVRSKRPAAAVHHLLRHLRRRQHPSCLCPNQLRCLARLAHHASRRLVQCCLHGRGHRGRCDGTEV